MVGPRRRRPLRTAELVFVAGLVVLTVVELLIAGGPPALHVLGGLVAIAAMAVHRTHLIASTAAVAVATVIVGLDAPPLAPGVATVVLLTLVVRRLQPPVSAGLGTFAATCVVVAALIGAGPFGAALTAFVCALAAGLGLYLRGVDWRRAEATAATRREERLAIAGELHDVVGHHLTGIVVQAQAARHLAARQPSAAVDALARIEREGSAALAAVRQLVGTWRADSAPTRPAATWDDVRATVHRAAEGGLPVTLQLEPDLDGAAPDLVASVHRIVTEALTNASRHAVGATAVRVDIRRSADRLDVAIVDDGRGATETVDAGHGLVGMRERVELLGGDFQAGPGPAGGWRVHVALPAGPRR